MDRREKTESDKKDDNNKDSSYESTLKKFAKLASESQLKGAINDPVVDPALKKIAQEELENRKEDVSVDEKVEATVKDNTNDKTGFKKIVQTYVKVNGNTIVLNMKGEDKYKAKKGDFYMESESNESLTDFKKKVKEAAEKHFNEKENDKNKDVDKKNDKNKSTIPNFKSDEEYVQWSREKNVLNNETFGKKNYEKLKSSVEQLSDSKINKSIKLKSLRHEILEYKKEGFDLGVDFYSKEDSETKLQIQSLMIKEGLLPFADETTVNSKNYNCFINKSFDETKSFYKKESDEIKQNMTNKEEEALNFYTDSGYTDLREYNYSSNKEKYKKDSSIDIEELDKSLYNLIDKNPLKENLVLYRRMSDYETIKRNLSVYHNAKIGDIIQDISFQSFAIKPQSYFGNDFQITLLAKKGDKVMNAQNFSEREYIVQKETKFKVIAKGFNSMVVKIV